MNHLFLIALLLLSTVLSAQYIYPTHYEGCNTSQFALEGKQIYAEKQARTLLKEIIQGIDKAILKKAKGEIMIQIIVDTMGTPCVLSIKNSLKGKIKKIDFKQIIDTQTKWTCPMNEGKKDRVCVLLKLTFIKDKIIIQRIGYNSKVGHVELDKFVMRKK
ncbi:MAG: hypothetical protein KAG64_00505 [Bacteroidales bacterium]|nr:hypothetical protein [Bacteroidales bacterium]